MTGRTQPIGVIVFSALLITGSLYKLWGFLNYDYYAFMFQQLSGKVIRIRYCSSVILRVVGLSAGIGLLFLKDIFRKLLVALCLLTFASLYWKHPFFVFENISRLTERQFLTQPSGGGLAYPLHPWISMLFNYTLDIIFSGAALYYFTRPRIKARFD